MSVLGVVVHRCYAPHHGTYCDDRQLQAGTALHHTTDWELQEIFDPEGEFAE